MSYTRKSLTSISAAAVAVMTLTSIAIWQFYMFVTFKHAQGITSMEGGNHHLWLGLGVGLLAGIVGLFLFSVLLRQDKGRELPITS